jgi:hypothetical protein
MNLYSRRKFLASAVFVLVCGAAFTGVLAQKRKAHKLRATAVLEVTTDSAGIVVTRVIPVTILDEGVLRDASIYKTTPRPMALDTGIVYEGQKAGTPVGYATILSSTNNQGWAALAKWQLPDVPKKAQAPPPVVPDERPTLHRGGEGGASSTPSATPADDRPTMHRSSESTASPTPSATPATSNNSPAPTESAPASATEDADRPLLKRREPEKQEPTSPAQTPQPKSTPPKGAVPAIRTPMVVPGTRTLVAVSDTETADIRSYEFKWKAGEEEQMEPKMRKLALAQLPRENAQLTPNSLKNVVMRSFDLDMSNDAVIVLSAEIAGNYPAPGAKAASGKPISRYVTVIARVDFDGVPQKLASSVTDSSRLDVAPRLELIDAVDVDGDGLAELLFREYSFDQESFIIYGVGRSTVTKVFEGAGTPLQGKN